MTSCFVNHCASCFIDILLFKGTLRLSKPSDLSIFNWSSTVDSESTPIIDNCSVKEIVTWSTFIESAIIEVKKLQTSSLVTNDTRSACFLGWSAVFLSSHRYELLAMSYCDFSCDCLNHKSQLTSNIHAWNVGNQYCSAEIPCLYWLDNPRAINLFCIFGLWRPYQRPE